MVLVIIRVRDGAKILKPWFGCTVPEVSTIADVFTQFSSGVLDNSAPLPDEYRTTSVEASIGKSPLSIYVKISCNVTVNEAVAILGNYIEFCVSKISDVQIVDEMMEGAVASNAFTVLMKATNSRLVMVVD